MRLAPGLELVALVDPMSLSAMRCMPAAWMIAFVTEHVHADLGPCLGGVMLAAAFVAASHSESPAMHKRMMERLRWRDVVVDCCCLCIPDTVPSPLCLMICLRLPCSAITPGSIMPRWYNLCTHTAAYRMCSPGVMKMIPAAMRAGSCRADRGVPSPHLRSRAIATPHPAPRGRWLLPRPA